MQRDACIEYRESFSGDVPQTHADIEKAQRLLGYAPQTSVLDGLTKMYEWYINEYLAIAGLRHFSPKRVYVFD